MIRAAACVATVKQCCTSRRYKWQQYGNMTVLKLSYPAAVKIVLESDYNNQNEMLFKNIYSFIVFSFKISSTLLSVISNRLQVFK